MGTSDAGDTWTGDFDAAHHDQSFDSGFGTGYFNARNNYPGKPGTNRKPIGQSEHAWIIDNARNVEFADREA